MDDSNFSNIGNSLPCIDGDPVRIYVILDHSRECDSWEVPTQVVYVGTSRQKAIEHFNKYYRRNNTLEDEKWIYEYELVEYSDGYSFAGGTANTIEKTSW